MDLQGIAQRKIVALTTRGRKSGQPRTVKIWFVTDGPDRILVQHASRAPANWYMNLVRNPDVSLDFGDGSVAGRASAITDPAGVKRVLRLVRRKYPLAWIIQLLGWGRQALAAEIRVGDQPTART